ncbi:MAG: hypothetical protein U0599_24100 [Vicinamibacteria bacterium]
MTSPPPTGLLAPRCSRRLRFMAAAALAVYVPSYAAAYGLANFLVLCNLTVLLVGAGLWTCNRLLLSSQAVAILLVGSVWTLDLLTRLVVGRHLLGGGTAYMWDPQWPLFTRLLSLYHVVLPPLLVLVLRRIGYDRRGYRLQAAIAVVAVSIGRLFGPEVNLNQAYVELVFGRTWGGPFTHVAAVIAFLTLLVYPLSHLFLARLCVARGGGAEAGGRSRVA